MKLFGRVLIITGILNLGFTVLFIEFSKFQMGDMPGIIGIIMLFYFILIVIGINLMKNQKKFE